MKGLFIKDFRYLLMQKNFIAAIMVISIANAVFLNNVSFPLGFMTFVISLYTINTMAYDEYDNGNAFLFTLPFTRKDYIREKYVLGLVLVGISMAVALSISLVINTYLKKMLITELIGIALVLIAIVIMLLSVNIPIHLKFGGEKGMIAIFAVYGVLAITGLVLYKLSLVYTGISYEELLKIIDKLSPFKVAAVLIIASIAAVLISYGVSLRIIKNKEF